MVVDQRSSRQQLSFTASTTASTDETFASPDTHIFHIQLASHNRNNIDTAITTATNHDPLNSLPSIQIIRQTLLHRLAFVLGISTSVLPIRRLVSTRRQQQQGFTPLSNLSLPNHPLLSRIHHHPSNQHTPCTAIFVRTHVCCLLDHSGLVQRHTANVQFAFECD